MFLILFFRERLGFALVPANELAAFRAGGVRYRDTGAGFLTPTKRRGAPHHRLVARRPLAPGGADP